MKINFRIKFSAEGSGGGNRGAFACAGGGGGGQDKNNYLQNFEFDTKGGSA